MKTKVKKFKGVKLSETDKAMKRAIGQRKLNQFKATLLAHWASRPAWDNTEAAVLKMAADGHIPSNPEEFAKLHLNWLVQDFAGKVWAKETPPEQLAVLECQLELHPPSVCSVVIEDREYEITVGGAIRLVGRASVSNNGLTHIIKVYTRYIGKTFWQYCGYSGGTQID